MSEGAFKHWLEPVAMPGENLRLDPLNIYVKIRYYEEIPGFIEDFGALASGNSTAITEVENMEMSENQVGQFRIKPLDDIDIQVYQGRGVGRFAIKNVLCTILPLTEQLSPYYNSTELFVYEDEPPWFQVTNNGTIDLKKTRVLIQGFRFVVETLKEAPTKYTVIPVAGWGSRPMA